MLSPPRYLHSLIPTNKLYKLSRYGVKILRQLRVFKNRYALMHTLLIIELVMAFHAFPTS